MTVVEKFGITGGILVLVFWAAFGLGWVMNIVKFCGSDFKAPYKAEIVRGVGIPIPIVGAIAGYMTIEDGTEENN